MNEKMTEKEWERGREFTKRKLETMRLDIEICKEIGVLLGAETDYCGVIMYQINNMLHYWNERSTASRIRFVEGVKDEES